MSTVFTPVTAGFDWQQVSFINELALAYAERNLSPTPSPDFTVVAGSDIQRYQYWSDLQHQVEILPMPRFGWDGYVNHTLPIPSTGWPTMFTSATWRAAAGLDTVHPVPWRRATSWTPDPTTPDWHTDVTFSYGYCQFGDIIGPWIFEDLQKALSALKWTYRQSYDGADMQFKELLTQDDPATHAAAWPGVGWGSWLGYNTLYQVNTYAIGPYGFPPLPSYYSSRVKGRPRLTGIYTGVPSTCDVYLYADYLDPAVWNDLDGLGLASQTWYFFETTPSSSAAARNASIMGDDVLYPAIFGRCPLTLLGSPVPPPDTYGQVQLADSEYPYQLGQLWILKWDFTNANP